VESGWGWKAREDGDGTLSEGNNPALANGRLERGTQIILGIKGY